MNESDTYNNNSAGPLSSELALISRINKQTSRLELICSDLTNEQHKGRL